MTAYRKETIKKVEQAITLARLAGINLELTPQEASALLNEIAHLRNVLREVKIIVEDAQLIDNTYQEAADVRADILFPIEETLDE